MAILHLFCLFCGTLAAFWAVGALRKLHPTLEPRGAPRLDCSGELDHEASRLGSAWLWAA